MYLKQRCSAEHICAASSPKFSRPTYGYLWAKPRALAEVTSEHGANLQKTFPSAPRADSGNPTKTCDRNLPRGHHGHCNLDADLQRPAWRVSADRKPLNGDSVGSALFLLAAAAPSARPDNKSALGTSICLRATLV